MSRAVGQGRTALAVDDEPLVLMATADMLRDLGFDVLEAGAGLDALEILQAREDVILLLTDIRMPGMDGVELAEQARRRHPHLKVIFASGDTTPHRQLSAPLLAKPYGPRDLERIVERGLQA